MGSAVAPAADLDFRPVPLPRRSPMSTNLPSGSNHPSGSDGQSSLHRMPEFSTAGDDDQSEAAIISRHLVQIYRRPSGRGPNRARTFLQPQFAVTVSRDLFTTAEQTLLADGATDEV